MVSDGYEVAADLDVREACVTAGVGVSCDSASAAWEYEAAVVGTDADCVFEAGSDYC